MTLVCVEFLHDISVEDRYTEIILNLKLYLKKRSIEIVSSSYLKILWIYSVRLFESIIPVSSTEEVELDRWYVKC